MGGSGNALRRFIALLALAAVVVAVILLLPFGRAAFEDIRDKLGKASAISPTSVSASAEVPGHPGGNAADGLTNRYWGAPGIGASVTFAFRSPFRLVDLAVHTGASKKAQDFQAQGRPTVVDLVVTSEDGSVHRQHVSLGDKPGQQTVVTGVSDVVKVELVVREAAGVSAGRHIALGEVEFFRRS